MSLRTRIDRIKKRIATRGTPADIALAINRFSANIASRQTHSRPNPDGSCPPGWRCDMSRGWAICQSPPQSAYCSDCRAWHSVNVAWSSEQKMWLGNAGFDSEHGIWLVAADYDCEALQV